MSNIETLRRDFETEAIPHMSALYSFAMRLTRDPDDASDLVQETFLKGFRFFDKFERGTNCKAWLFRILKNSFINKFRQSAGAPDLVKYGDIEEFYTVLVLCDIEGFTYAEIAEHIDCPIGTVRSRLHRARKILAGRLASYAMDRGFITAPGASGTTTSNYPIERDEE